MSRRTIRCCGRKHTSEPPHGRRAGGASLARYACGNGVRRDPPQRDLYRRPFDSPLAQKGGASPSYASHCQDVHVEGGEPPAVHRSLDSRSPATHSSNPARAGLTTRKTPTRHRIDPVTHLDRGYPGINTFRHPEKPMPDEDANERRASRLAWPAAGRTSPAGRWPRPDRAPPRSAGPASRPSSSCRRSGDPG